MGKRAHKPPAFGPRRIQLHGLAVEFDGVGEAIIEARRGGLGSQLVEGGCLGGDGREGA